MLIKSLIILLFIFIVWYWNSNARKLNKIVLEHCNLKSYPFFNRFDVFIKYKKALLKLNHLYTYDFDYMGNEIKDILVCEYLTETKINEKYIESFKQTLNQYKNINIHKKALKNLNECIYTLFVIESAFNYFQDHRKKAYSTLNRLEGNYFEKSNEYKLYPRLVNDRKKNLYTLIFQIDRVSKSLLKEKKYVEELVGKYEKCKNPTLWKVIEKLITAPVRHSVNLTTSILRGDVKGSFTNGTRVALTLFGVGIISDSLEIIELLLGFEDIESLDHVFYHVDSHWVEEYTRQDGTIVSGYYRGGESGYFRS